ncbi:MAG: type IVB secretion system protein IcmH/DotU [Pseudomonadota bacterium]
MNNTIAPSLLGRNPTHQAESENSFTPRSLLDLMYDGFYALFMLKNRCAPQDDASFSGNITRFLEDFDRNAKKMNASAEDINAAKYAYCAAVDEIILRSQFDIRAAWERRPLQLAIFGDQLAGEAFFDKIEELRAKGSAHIQALEVFHMCLLLGFEGKYMIEGSEKLNYLTARLGDEIAHIKGKTAGFAPHWARPDQIINKLRNDVPIWVICSVFALIAMSGYSALNWMLSSSTSQSISAYNDVVKLAPRAANITITLP